MRFEWDESKNASNLQKHGVRFEEAARVFADEFAVSFLDTDAGDEERWRTSGLFSARRILVTMHTAREAEDGETIRIISGHPATAKERQAYEEGVG